MSSQNKKEKKHRIALTLMFSVAVFVILVITAIIVGVSVYLIIHIDITNSIFLKSSNFIILFMAFSSVIIGTALTTAVINIPLVPVNTLINGMNRLASGDYKVKIQFKKPLSIHPTMVELSDSFNIMAAELDSTEVLGRIL